MGVSMTKHDDATSDPSEAKRNERTGSPLPILIGLAVLMALVILYGIRMN